MFSPSSSEPDQITKITQNNTIDTTSSNVRSSSSSHTPSSQETVSEAPREHLSSSVYAMVTRSKVGVTKPNPRYAQISQMVIIKEPTPVKEALQDEDCTQAMKNEIAVLEKNQTYTLVPKQEGMNIIGVKWVFKVKYKANNTFDKLKA